MTRKRVAHWDTSLLQWARSVVGQPFIWGQTDCGSLVRAALVVMYGEDLVPKLSYKSARGAKKALRDLKCMPCALHKLGAVEVSRSFARQGDILLESDGGHGFEAAYVLVAGHALGADPVNGVLFVPHRAITGRAFRLPNG